MKISFRPSGRGVSQVLGELESEIMSILWDHPESSAREVHAYLLRRKRELAYTTVLTVLDRLHKKGLLEKHREGKADIFSPGISQKEFNESLTHDVLEGLLKEDSRPILSTFVDLVGADEELLEELEQLIQQKRS